MQHAIHRPETPTPAPSPVLTNKLYNTELLHVLREFLRCCTRYKAW